MKTMSRCPHQGYYDGCIACATERLTEEIQQFRRAARLIARRPVMVSGNEEMMECDEFCKALGLRPWDSEWRARQKRYEDGEPCPHPGCLAHVSHPCEGCGRVAGVARKLGSPRDRAIVALQELGWSKESAIETVDGRGENDDGK